MHGRFHQEQEASEYVQALSADMLRYPDELTVAGSAFLTRCAEDLDCHLLPPISTLVRAPKKR